MILFDIRDMRDEDMTSKLDFCQECNGENIDGFVREVKNDRKIKSISRLVYQIPKILTPMAASADRH